MNGNKLTLEIFPSGQNVIGQTLLFTLRTVDVHGQPVESTGPSVNAKRPDGSLIVLDPTQFYQDGKNVWRAVGIVDALGKWEFNAQVVHPHTAEALGSVTIIDGIPTGADGWPGWIPAADSAAQAAASAAAALASENAAKASEQNAATSAAAALASEQGAANSLASIGQSEVNAATSAAAALASENAAKSSEQNAAASATKSETEADKSELQAQSSASSASSASTSAATATQQAQLASTARVGAENAVGQVTVGSTQNLSYPEIVQNLFTASGVSAVFVYDTRLDSDGGKWTDGCSGASWFREPLNTATRGAKRSFPKVALIVGHANAMTIYDALDIDPGTGAPRMWMVFQGSSDNRMLRVPNSSVVITDIKALNGKLYRTANHNARSFVMIDFAEDRALWSGALGGVGLKTDISNRNDLSLPWIAAPSSNYPQFNSGLSVDVRVLPGAPASSLTGLSIPTVVVTTTTNFSVVHPLRDQFTRSALVTVTGGYLKASLTSDNRIMALGATDTMNVEVGPIPYANTTTNVLWRTHRIGSGATDGLVLPARNAVGNIADAIQGAVAQTPQLCLTADDFGSPANGMVCAIGNSHNTGWMPGSSARLAVLCDGATGPVTSVPELLTNGDFETGDLTGWIDQTIGTGFATVTNGVLSIYRQDVSNIGRVAQEFDTIIGQTYILEYDQLATDNTAFAVGTTATAADVMSARTFAAIGTRTYQFTAISTISFVRIYPASTGATCRIDNVSVRPAAIDYSISQRGLFVEGVLQRNLVGAGNDVVAYSGFSASNYLQQSYNSGMDFGTGDFFVCGWANVTQNSECILERRAYSGGAYTGFGFSLISEAANWILRTFNGATTVATATSTTDPTTAGWVFVLAGRRNGVLEIWINGVREGTVADASNLTNTSATLQIGATLDGGFIHNGSLALVRMGASMPVASQIQRMFRNERQLFTLGARAFLGGTGTPRRVSRSRFSNQLAVAMSDGLSFFEDIQRVERHTSASLPPAMGGSDVTVVSMEAGISLIGTTVNAGVRRSGMNGLDLMPLNPASPQIPRILRVSGVTTDATPLTLNPRVQIGEREIVSIRSLIVGRVYGEADSESLTYDRRATYYRDQGGNVTIRGTVQSIGTDVEVTATADATFVIDTVSQTVAPQVTGVAGKRIVWTARIWVERVTQDQRYEELV